MKSIKIKIRGKKYLLKAHSYRAIFLYEEMTGKPIGEMSSFKDQVTFLYCLLKAANDDFNYSFPDFIDMLEEDDSIFQDFANLQMSDAEKKK